MILAETTNIVLLEEIGGKGHFITRNMASETPGPEFPFI